MTTHLEIVREPNEADLYRAIAAYRKAAGCEPTEIMMGPLLSHAFASIGRKGALHHMESSGMHVTIDRTCDPHTFYLREYAGGA